MVRVSANQARTLSHNLMPVAVREESLAACVTNWCWEEEDLSHLSCLFDGDRDEPLLTDNGTAMHLYRIVREATVKARRHAQANVVKMSLRRRDAALVLTVWDDGVGIPKADEREAGLGLRTMRYRADVMGASLSVELGEEGGTVVRCTLPLSAAKGD